MKRLIIPFLFCPTRSSFRSFGHALSCFTVFFSRLCIGSEFTEWTLRYSDVWSYGTVSIGFYYVKWMAIHKCRSLWPVNFYRFKISTYAVYAELCVCACVARITQIFNFISHLPVHVPSKLHPMKFIDMWFIMVIHLYLMQTTFAILIYAGTQARI